jgi:hypothetical protein
MKLQAKQRLTVNATKSQKPSVGQALELERQLKEAEDGLTRASRYDSPEISRCYKELIKELKKSMKDTGSKD